MFAFNHFYSRLGVRHFILNSEKWTEDVLQALLFLECALSGIYWGNTYLSKSRGTLQMLPTVTLKESEEMRGKAASQGCFPGKDPHWYCSVDYRWIETTEPLRGSFLTLCLEYHPSLFPPFSFTSPSSPLSPFTPPSLLFSTLSFIFELAYVFHMWNITYVKYNSYSGHNVCKYDGSTKGPGWRDGLVEAWLPEIDP